MAVYNELQTGDKYNEDGTFNWYSGQGTMSQKFLDKKLADKNAADTASAQATKDMIQSESVQTDGVVGRVMKGRYPKGKDFLNNWTYDAGFDESKQGKNYQQDWLRKNPEASRKDIHDQYVKEKSYGADFDALSDAEKNAQYSKYGEANPIKLKGVNWSYADGGLQFKEGAKFTGLSGRNEKKNLKTEKDWESKAKQDWINQQLQGEGIYGRGEAKAGKYAFRGEGSSDALNYVENANYQYGKGGAIGDSDWSKQFLVSQGVKMSQEEGDAFLEDQRVKREQWKKDQGYVSDDDGNLADPAVTTPADEHIKKDYYGTDGLGGTDTTVNEGKAIQPGQRDYEMMTTPKEDAASEAAQTLLDNTVEEVKKSEHGSWQDQELPDKEQSDALVEGGFNNGVIRGKKPTDTGTGQTDTGTGQTQTDTGTGQTQTGINTSATTDLKQVREQENSGPTRQERNRAKARERRSKMLSGENDYTRSSYTGDDSRRHGLLTGDDYKYSSTKKEKDRGYGSHYTDFTKDYVNRKM